MYWYRSLTNTETFNLHWKHLMNKEINDQLALLGGNKLINKEMTHYNSIGSEEVAAASQVVESGVLSQFIGAWGNDFFGGPKVQEFERKCEKYFDVKHAITVNSWTSGLIAAVGAIGIEPGDEVIVSPFTMCASATAIIQWNAIPVFADIDPKTFCIDPVSVEKNITSKTKAIISIDIFGQSANIDALMEIASKHNLKVISDTAQAPGATYRGKYAGTLSHVGGFSLNYHKHIHTGEGGILVTNDDDIASKLQLIRNHAEAVVDGKGTTNIANMIGYNFRLGEIECAIGIEQLKKLEHLTQKRQETAELLTQGLSGLPGLQTPIVQEHATHVYYGYPIVLDVDALGVSRKNICNALVAEGVTIGEGYVNVHQLPMYQQKIAYGSKGFPWNSDICEREVDYSKGICPTAEELHEKTFLVMPMCVYNFDHEDISLIISAFHKVWKNMELLR